MSLDANRLKELQERLKREGAKWEAGPTSRNKLTDEERRRSLGSIPEPRPAEQQEEGEEKPEEPASAALAFDLTNVFGWNYANAIQDQKTCGACVGFAVTAAMETTLRWRCSLPSNEEVGYGLPLLSAADIFFCGGGGDCVNGMPLTKGLDYAKDRGVVTAQCYPYRPSSICQIVPGDNQLRTTISGYEKKTTRNEMKAWLSTKGPLVANMKVYDDFFDYKRGIYHPTTTKYIGGHALCIVGYDDLALAWKVKNSWGTDWGEEGYGWIMYGVCDLDDVMYGVDDFSTFYSYPMLQLGNSVNYDRGASPAVALSNSARVEVHQSHWELANWYRTGEVEGGWNSSHKYDQGWGPDVALNNNGLAVEVHKSAYRSALWYRVGSLQGTEVSWGAPHEFDSGLHPGVALNDAGWVVEVHQAAGETRLHYRVGQVNGNRIDWGDSHYYDDGIHPRVAINNENQVVEIHQSNLSATIWHHIGQINEDKTITWEASHQVDTGYYPGVALDDNGRVIEVHQGHGAIGLWYRTGNLLTDYRRVDWIEDARNYDKGYYAMVAMNQNGNVMEVHQSETELAVWYHEGSLSAVKKP